MIQIRCKCIIMFILSVEQTNCHCLLLLFGKTDVTYWLQIDLRKVFGSSYG